MPRNKTASTKAPATKTTTPKKPRKGAAKTDPADTPAPTATSPEDTTDAGKDATDAQPAARPRQGGRKKTLTLADLADLYVANLEKRGKSETTRFGYRQELRAAESVLGSDTPIDRITVDAVAAYFTSDKVTKTRAGRAAARPGVLKRRRVLRLAMTFAVEQGLLNEVPVPPREIETAT